MLLYFILLQSCKNQNDISFINSCFFFIIAKPCLPFIKFTYVKWFRIRWTYSARIFHVLHIWFKIYIVCSFFFNCTLASLALIACRGYLRGLIYLYSVSGLFSRYLNFVIVIVKLNSVVLKHSTDGYMNSAVEFEINWD